MIRSRHSLMYRLAAVAIVTAVAITAGGGAGRAPRAESTLAAGVLAQSNSKAGSAILNTGDLGPGDSSSGTVTITNTGSLAGDFELGKSGLADMVGPGGGTLSDSLALQVEDVTAGSEIYQGALGAMPPRPLGTFQPGESHTYRFTVDLPDRGDSVDNLVAGASTTVHFDWVATADPAPDPPAPTQAAPNQAAPNKAAPRARRPKVTIRVPRSQELLRQRGIYLRVRCDRPCVVELTVRLKAGAHSFTRPWRIRRAVPGGRTVKVLLRIPKRDRRRMRALVRRHPRSIRVLVSVRVKDRKAKSLKASAERPIYPLRPMDGANRFP